MRPYTGTRLYDAVDTVKRARQAVEDAKRYLKPLVGKRFIHKLPNSSRQVVVENFDPIRLRVLVRGPVIRGWIEVAALEEEPEELEGYAEVGNRAEVDA